MESIWCCLSFVKTQKGFPYSYFTCSTLLELSEIAFIMPFTGPGMAPVGDSIAGPAISRQQLLTLRGIERLLRGPAEVSERLAVALPRIRVDIVERQDLDGMTQPLPRRELLRGGVLRDVLVKLLARVFPLLVAVLVDSVEELRGPRDGFRRPALRPVGDLLHDGLDQQQKERVSWSGRHPCVGDRVVESIVRAHPTEEGLSPALVHVVRCERSWLCVRYGRDVVCLEEMVRREDAFDVEVSVDTKEQEMG